MINQITKCDNYYYMNKSEQIKLERKRNPLERNMLRYLLLFDPEIKLLKTSGIKVFIRPFLMGFGLMQNTIE